MIVHGEKSTSYGQSCSAPALTSPLSVMTVAVIYIRSAGSDVPSVGGGGTTGVETLHAGIPDPTLGENT